MTGQEPRDSLRREIEETKVAYDALLASIPDDAWKHRSGNPPWRVRNQMWHLASGMEFTPKIVAGCKKGKGMNPPMAQLMNRMMTKWSGRKATKESVAQQYAAGHEATLEALDQVGESEWKQGTKFFGQEFTVESAFQTVKEHFEEHRKDVLTGLGRM